MAPMSEPRAQIAIVDYGMGNLRSAAKALEHVGAAVTVTSERDVIEAADALILPGVGAFPEAMRQIGERRLAQPIRERVAAGTPLLGICLGMQLLFDFSDEHGWGGGPRPAPRPRRCAPGRRPQASPHRLVRDRAAAPSSAHGGPRTRGRAVLLRPLVRRPARSRAPARDEPPRRGVRRGGRPRQRLRHPVPPGEVERGGPADALRVRRDRHAGGGRIDEHNCR